MQIEVAFSSSEMDTFKLVIENLNVAIVGLKMNDWCSESEKLIRED